MIGSDGAVLHYWLQCVFSLELFDFALKSPHGIDVLEHSGVSDSVTRSNQTSTQGDIHFVFTKAELGLLIFEYTLLIIPRGSVHEFTSVSIRHDSKVL